MNKKAYNRPTLRIVSIGQTRLLCASEVRNTQDNLGPSSLRYGGAGIGSAGPARAKGNAVDWDTDWSE